VLKWICERVDGVGKAQTTPIGNLPTLDALDLSGLNLPQEDLHELFGLDKAGWLAEAGNIEDYFKNYGDRIPSSLLEQLNRLRERLRNS